MRCPYRTIGACALSAIVLLSVLVPASATPGTTSTARRFADSADAAVSARHPRAHYGHRRWLLVGGRGHWRTYLRFHVSGLSGRVRRATIVLHVARTRRLALDVRKALGNGWGERRIGGKRTPKVGGRVAPRMAPRSCRSRRHARTCTVTIAVYPAAVGGGSPDFVLTARGRGTVRIASRESGRNAPRLMVRTAAAAKAPAPGAAGPGTTASPTPAGARPPGAVAGIWTSPAELASRPESGPAWQALKSAADGSLGTANIADQNSDHDVLTLAAALVYARTGAAGYRTKAADAIAAAIGTERGGQTLALGRNLASYVIAADLIGLGGYDAGLDGRFRSWLSAVRTEDLGGDTLVSTHETRPNNWGTMAGASRVAADVYLGDTGDLNRAATVFRGWLGDRSAYTGFSFGEPSWQADAGQSVGIDPPGAVKQGLSIDGALPDDMRRGCAFTLPPCHTEYAWEAMQGVVVQAEILARRGYDAFGWSNQAVLRAAQFLDRLDHQYGGWWATADDEWQPWLINSAYGTSFPATAPAGIGKVMGWTDWVFGR
ncbi:MAG: CBM96 family carbohydrate-binding protein [Solirubrobacteraceae bacterium]